MMRAFLKWSLFMVFFNFFVCVYVSLPYFTPFGGIDGLGIYSGNSGSDFLCMAVIFMVAALVVTILLDHGCRAVRKKIFQKTRIGEIFVSMGLITPEELIAALSTQKLKIGEILKNNAPASEVLTETVHAYPKTNYVKMGEMLLKIGFSSGDEIHWALKQKRNRVERY